MSKYANAYVSSEFSRTKSFHINYQVPGTAVRVYEYSTPVAVKRKMKPPKSYDLVCEISRTRYKPTYTLLEHLSGEKDCWCTSAAINTNSSIAWVLQTAASAATTKAVPVEGDRSAISQESDGGPTTFDGVADSKRPTE